MGAVASVPLATIAMLAGLEHWPFHQDLGRVAELVLRLMDNQLLARTPTDCARVRC